jgi:SAM-dependent methyltransferase
MNPTQRFSSRVADYVRYRPSYPAALLEKLTDAGALAPDSIIADIGSGTGLLTRLFLERGHTVYGIEPNADMRLAGEDQLKDVPTFKSIDAPAEATTLPDHSIDLIVAGQAFHWFDRERSKVEFRRILRTSRSCVALIWNERLVETSPFLRGYEDLLKQFATDYTKVDHRQITPELLALFFNGDGFHLIRLPNRQVFDYAGLQGRLLSSSYTPGPDLPAHSPMLAQLRQLFDQHQDNGRVTFEYETRCYLGRV